MCGVCGVCGVCGWLVGGWVLVLAGGGGILDLGLILTIPHGMLSFMLPHTTDDGGYASLWPSLLI